MAIRTVNSFVGLGRSRRSIPTVLREPWPRDSPIVTLLRRSERGYGCDRATTADASKALPDGICGSAVPEASRRRNGLSCLKPRTPLGCGCNYPEIPLSECVARCKYGANDESGGILSPRTYNSALRCPRLSADTTSSHP